MNAQIHNQDCVIGMANELGPDSVDLTVSSIPFGALFMYSGKAADIGNNDDGGETSVDFVASFFGLHMRFMVEQLFRVQKPGTNVCIHIQQLVTYRIQHGFMGRRDFRGAVVDLFEAGGFEWKGEFVIRKNPQLIAQRQKLHSLLFITGRRNARDLAPAVNDFVLIFQKPGEAAPVRALRGDDNPGGWVTTEDWIRDAAGVWTDIRETDVLEGWQSGREEDDEKHVAPLQLEVIRRLVRLYSNPGELVLDPFAGIGSTGWVAIEQRRTFAGFELKESYFALMRRYLSRAEAERSEELPLFAATAAPASYGTTDSGQSGSPVD